MVIQWLKKHYIGTTTILLFISLYVGLSYGAISISMTDFINTMGSKLLGIRSDTPAITEALIWHLRIPRLLLSIIIGSGLACAGVALQGILRNPLVEPGFIGVSSGAALFAVLYFVFKDVIPFIGNPQWSMFILPFYTFLGGLLCTYVIFYVAKKGMVASTELIVLAGIGLNALLASLIGFVLYFADENALRSFTFWTFGSLAKASWQYVFIGFILISLPTYLLIRYHRVFNALSLGEEMAQTMGINTEKSKRMIIILSALIVGTTVAFCGVIGFIGLMVPHLVRLVVGANHKPVLIGSAYCGGILLLCADILSRTVVAPAEMPIGVITALLGSPIFLWMLLRYRNHYAQENAMD